MEHAGYIVDRNLLNLSTKMLKRGAGFSRDDGLEELLAITERLQANLPVAASLFV